MMFRFFAFLGVISSLCGAPAPLQSFTLKEYLNHSWKNELVHFPLDITTGEKSLSLTDADGHFLPCQFTDLKRQGGHLTGSVWTVVSLEPGREEVFHLVPAPATSRMPVSAPTNKISPQKVRSTLSVIQDGKYIVLANEYLAVRLPKWTGLVKGPTDLTRLPTPWESVSRKTGSWLGNARWINDGPPLYVKEASTQIIEQGPVKVIVRQSLTLADGKTYSATVQLALGQDAALITEDSIIDAPKAAISFSMKTGLDADHIFWNNQYAKTDHAGEWKLTDTTLKFDKDEVICKMRPWSFWWLGDITIWAGFYHTGTDNFVGILALHPSHWSPTGWDGFDRTEIPVVTGPNGKLDLPFKLLATKKKDNSGVETEVPMHREWALTAGTVKENVSGDDKTAPRLRRQLIQYSEYPLDEVKDYGFDFTAAKPNQTHPYLILSRDDVQRVRREAQTVPSVKAKAGAAIRYVTGCRGDVTLEKEGWEAFYTKNYILNGLGEKLQEAYLGSNDPGFGKQLGAAVKGLAQELLNTFLEKPARPAIGSYGPWFSESITRLLFHYDLIAGTGVLTHEEELAVRNALVFGAQVLSHPDYWNPGLGLASLNPNMTNSIILPEGLLGLYLAGHPKADKWLEASEKELKTELKDWISPGGAWIESPGYQTDSLDGMFLLSQAIRNVQSRDYFANPQFKAMMDYYGFILTPPDRRFPPRPLPDVLAAPMTLPSIGDTFAGWITCFNGWMAAATVRTDPAYSARQQFYWKAQGYYSGRGERAKGLTMALTNPDLSGKPPAELSRSFPGFGSVLRTSWKEPDATYVCHRTGPNHHHYHDDFNSIVLYSKGAPLCLDFGNLYQPVRRDEARYHNRVSFDRRNSGEQDPDASGELVELRSLPSVIDYSYGKSHSGHGQEDHRHILLVKSGNPLGANYVVMRDTTAAGQSNQELYWNLFCLSKDPTILGNLVHFPGQLGVDLDVYMLSPAAPKIEKDHWNWKQEIYVWSGFSEEQYGMHVALQFAGEDFFSLLYPRARGQAAAQVIRSKDGSGLRVGHMEGTDLVLLSPGKPAKLGDATMWVRGEISFARKATDGSLRLAVVKGPNNESEAAIGDWRLETSSPVSVLIQGNKVSGESAGDSHVVRITLPPRFPAVVVSVDGIPVDASRQGRELTINFPAGNHTFSIQRK